MASYEPAYPHDSITHADYLTRTLGRAAGMLEAAARRRLASATRRASSSQSLFMHLPKKERFMPGLALLFNGRAVAAALTTYGQYDDPWRLDLILVAWLHEHTTLSMAALDLIRELVP